MSWYLYSTESIPNKNLVGKPTYTPEYLLHGGVQIIVEGGWQKVEDKFYNFRHEDWKDRAGRRTRIAGDEVMEALANRFKDRGVIIVDHEPSAEEKKELESRSKALNDAFRMSQVEWYETQVEEKKVTGHGRTKPTAYEDQCYQLLGLTKPYSVEAMRAQRHPGEAVGEQIVAALERLEKRRQDQFTGTPEPETTPTHASHKK